MISSPDPARRICIWLCGGLRVEVDGRRMEDNLGRRKSRELLALLVERQGAVGRETLVELLWPEDPPGNRLAQLRVLLTELRRCLGPDALDGRAELRLVLPATEWVDVRAGTQELEHCRAAIAQRRWADARTHAASASQLLAGGFLVGHDAAWIDERRDEIEALELEALEAFAAASMSEPGHAAEAITAAERLVSRAPFRESGYSLLMRALVAEGNPAQALEAFGRLRLLLREELGTIPSVALTALHVWVLEQSQEQATGNGVEPETRYACRPDGVSIAFQVLGDGPVDVVIVPGFMSHLDAQWANPAYRSWLRRLASSRRVITLDKAGTGASDNVPRAQTMEDWAADVLAVLDEVRSPRPVLLGMSEGAAVAVGFAAAHADRVRAIVFYGAMARALPKPGYLWEHRDVIQNTMDRFAEIELSWGCGGSIDLWAPTTAGNAAQRRAWAVFERASGSPASIAQRTQALLATDVCDRLPQIRVPTLVLHRTGDRIVSVYHGRHFANVIPGARHLELDGDDHIPYLGDSEALIAAIDAFIAGLPPSSTPARALSVERP